MFNYEILGNPLERLNEIRDLGVVFDRTLSFARHVDLIIAKAYSMLGFMMRICADFNDAAVLFSLYNAHVRSHLEYVAVVWSPTPLV